MNHTERYEKFIISQKGILIRANKVLLLEFPEEERGWDFPGGRLNNGEFGLEPLHREIKEELGFDNFEILGVFDYETWRTISGVSVCGIVNLIKNDVDKIQISQEHKSFRWIEEHEIDDYNFFWPPAKRMLKNAFKYYKLLKNEK